MERNDSAASNVTFAAHESPLDLRVVTYAATIFALTLLASSVVLNVSALGCVCCCGANGLVRSCHFSLQVVVLCVVHTLYFAVKSTALVLLALHLLDVIPDSVFEASQPFRAMAPDLQACLAGTFFLVVSALAVDCLMATRTRSRSAVCCCRAATTTVALVVGAAAFLVVFALKFDYFDLEPWMSSLTREGAILVQYVIYLTCFVLAPSFVTVIVSTVNWVSNASSSRPRRPWQRAALALDRRFMLLSVFVLLAFLATVLVAFSIDLNVFETREEADAVKLTRTALEALVDFGLALYPIILVSIVAPQSKCCRN